jgi:hypothetical protein
MLLIRGFYQVVVCCAGKGKSGSGSGTSTEEEELRNENDFDVVGVFIVGAMPLATIQRAV